MNYRSKTVGILEREKPSRPAVDDYGFITGHLPREHATTARHGFQHHIRHPLVKRRINQEIRRVVEIAKGRPLLPGVKTHDATESLGAHLPEQSLALRPIAY